MTRTPWNTNWKTDDAIRWCKEHNAVFMYAHGIFTVSIGGYVTCSPELTTALMGNRLFQEGTHGM